MFIDADGNRVENFNVLDQTDAPWHSPLGPLEVIEGADQYETVAASQTDQALGATGAAGDYLRALVITVATAATGTVSVKDGSGSAIPITAANTPIGAYTVTLGLTSTSGAWSVTTGAGATVIACGSFT